MTPDVLDAPTGVDRGRRAATIAADVDHHTDVFAGALGELA